MDSNSQTNSDAPKAALTADGMFKTLCRAIRAEHLRGKMDEGDRTRLAADLQMRIGAHIRAKSGHTTLVAYHNNGASDEDKKALYKECLSAIVNRDFSKLEGQIASGQAVVMPEAPAPDEAEKPSEEAPTPTVNRVLEQARTEIEIEKAATAPAPVAPIVGDLAQALAILGRYIPATQTKPAEIDEGKVKEIIQDSIGNKFEEFSKGVEALRSEIKDELQKAFDAAVKNLPPRDAIEIKASNGEVKEIVGATHWQLPQLIAWLSADVPVWLWGQAGGGKTHLGYQLAEALGLKPYVISVDPTMTVGKLLGFRNMATGEFVEGFLYRPFKEGGLVVIDEIDTGDPGILAAINALIANGRYLFPNGECVERHKDFRIMAGGNTKGCGAVAGYTARQRLDAATLDRFAVIELEYDIELTEALALGRAKAAGKTWKQAAGYGDATCEQWVNYWKRARETASSVLISPRAAILGCRALRAGVPINEVAEALIFKLVTPDTRASIVRSIGEVTP